LVIGTIADLGIPGLLFYTMIFVAALTTRKNEAQIVWPVRAALLAALLMGIPLNPAQHGGILWLLVGQACLLRALLRNSVLVPSPEASSLGESTSPVLTVPGFAPAS
jgi:hypothetical protein